MYLFLSLSLSYARERRPERMHRLLISLTLLLCSCCFLITAASLAGLTDSLRLDLIRPAPAADVSLVEYARQLVRSDLLRQRIISSRISRRGRRLLETAEESFSMPLNSGAFTGTGLYFVPLQLGTPAQKFVLAADIGSDLTWVKCRAPRPHCRKKCGAGAGAGATSGYIGVKEKRLFKPAASKTFKAIKCSSKLCKDTLPFSLTKCPTPASPCAYEYSYSDGSKADGVFAHESATIKLINGRREKLRGVVVGCTSSYNGQDFSATDGVLGLGYSPTSFAVRATARFGGRFSYCLVDHLSPRNESSYIIFGANPAFSPSSFSSVSSHAMPLPSTTKLVLDHRLYSFYAVQVEAISVDDEKLPIPAEVWDVAAGGGVILDSGTSATLLVEPAYKAVVAALSQRLATVYRVRDDDNPFEYCYKWDENDPPAVEMPKLTVHLAGGARLEPPAKSYIIDVAEGVKCIGLESAPWPGASTIGNILQQEHIWEFDVKNRLLRFQPSKCND